MPVLPYGSSRAMPDFPPPFDARRRYERTPEPTPACDRSGAGVVSCELRDLISSNDTPRRRKGHCIGRYARDLTDLIERVANKRDIVR